MDSAATACPRLYPPPAVERGECGGHGDRPHPPLGQPPGGLQARGGRHPAGQSHHPPLGEADQGRQRRGEAGEVGVMVTVANQGKYRNNFLSI